MRMRLVSGMARIFERRPNKGSRPKCHAANGAQATDAQAVACRIAAELRMIRRVSVSSLARSRILQRLARALGRPGLERALWGKSESEGSTRLLPRPERRERINPITAAKESCAPVELSRDGSKRSSRIAAAKRARGALGVRRRESARSGINSMRPARIAESGWLTQLTAKPAAGAQSQAAIGVARNRSPGR